MRGTCEQCGRENTTLRGELCQKCFAKNEKSKDNILPIREVCIFCGKKREWESYRTNWQCDKCGKHQFAHESYKKLLKSGHRERFVW